MATFPPARFLSRRILTLFTAGFLVAQSPANLNYQKRAGYSEGIRYEPSSGKAELNLIGAMVDYREAYQKLPGTFKAAFYLPKADQVYLTIREVDPRRNYWLDNLVPAKWKSGDLNTFAWSTGTVIASLNTPKTPFGLDQLAATARLGRASPSNSETVAPVALFYNRPPAGAETYRFIFRPTARMRLKFILTPEGKPAPAQPQQVFPSVLAMEPHEVKWSAKSLPDGWYHINVTGYAAQNNDPVNADIRFYHSARFGSR
jgi:hypothetical protein